MNGTFRSNKIILLYIEKNAFFMLKRQKNTKYVV